MRNDRGEVHKEPDVAGNCLRVALRFNDPWCARGYRWTLVKTEGTLAEVGNARLSVW